MGQGGATAPIEIFKAVLKFVIANVKNNTKYVKSGLSTNSKIVVILETFSYSIEQ